MTDEERLLRGILSWLPASLVLDAPLVWHQNKAGERTMPDADWYERVKDNMMVVLLRAREEYKESPTAPDYLK